MAAPPSKAPIGSEKAAALLVTLDQKLNEMRRKFAAYFNGFERMPPTLDFEHLKRDFRGLAAQTFSTGQSRFKAQNLIARWQVQRTIWERDLQRMEEGQFKPGARAAAMKPERDMKNDDD